MSGLCFGRRVLLLLLLCVTVPQPCSTQIQTSDVHKMIRSLSSALKGQACNVFGAGDEDMCGARGSSLETPSPQEVVSQLVNPAFGKQRFLVKETDVSGMLTEWAVGPGVKIDETTKLLNSSQVGGIASEVMVKSELVDRLAKTAEDLYSADEVRLDPNAVLYNETRPNSPQQSNWNAEMAADDSDFAGSYVDMTRCAHHFPVTAPMDRARTDRDAAVAHKLCVSMIPFYASGSIKGLSFQYFTSVAGLSLDYPASILGTNYDGRFDDWFMGATLTSKDIVFIVDQSSSMEGGTKCGNMETAISQIEALLYSLVTPRDRFTISLVGDGPTYNPCHGHNLVRGDKWNMNVQLQWLKKESANRKGEAALADGIVDALNLLFNASLPSRPKYIVVISDDSRERGSLSEQSFGAFFESLDPPQKLPGTGVNFVGITVTPSTGTATTGFDHPACLQRGLAFKTYQAPDELGSDTDLCVLRPTPVVTRDRTFQDSVVPMVDRSLLLNTSELQTLVGWPMSIMDNTSEPYFTRPRKQKDLGKRKSRMVVGVGRAVFDRRDKVPRLVGAVGADFLVDDLLDRINRFEPPSGFVIFLLQHRDNVGASLVHTGRIPDYANFEEFREILGEITLDFEVMEGQSVASSGLITEMVVEEGGFRSMNRTVIIDQDWSPHRDAQNQHLVRRATRLVTYSWLHVPGTIYAIGVICEGVPVTAGSFATPHLVSPPMCSDSMPSPYATPAAGGNATASYGCWRGTYGSKAPAVYHRLDLLQGEQTVGARFTAPWGGTSACGGQFCTLDTSTWIGGTGAWVEEGDFRDSADTAEIAKVLSSSAVFDGLDMDAVPGRRLRSLAANELKVTANFEPYWRKVFGVPATATPAAIDAAARAKVAGVILLFVLTDHDIFRGYPGNIFERGDGSSAYNLQRRPWNTRALTNPNLIVTTTAYLAEGTAPANSTDRTTWRITLAKSLLYQAKGVPSPVPYGSTSGPAKFGVAGAHYTYPSFANLFREATTLRSLGRYGCGDMGTGMVADFGIACFLIDANANIILDRKTLSLSNQPLSSLDYDPSLYNLYTTEPMLTQHLLAYSVLYADRLSLQVTDHTIYRVNQTALEAATAKRLQTAGAGASDPGMGLTGIEIMVEDSTPGGFATNTIWFYQVPDAMLYLVVVWGYTNSQQPTYCGPLSRTCPDVVIPTDTEAQIRYCGEPQTQPRHSGNDTYVGPVGDDLVTIRRFALDRPGSYVLECPQVVLTSGVVAAIAIIILLLAIASPFAWSFARRRLKQRRTLHYLSSRDKEAKASPEENESSSSSDEDDGENGPPNGPGGAVHINLAGAAGVGKVEAFIHHYKTLSERQSQLAEDLHKRDEGDLQAMRREAGAIGAEVEAVTAQLDFLQQRMQKQELISPKYERLRRRAGRLMEEARTVDREIEQVKEQGMLSGLDPSIADDLTEVNASVGGAALPSGTREALFHRIYFPHVVSPSAGNGAGGSSSFSPPNGRSAQQHHANGNHGSNGNGPSS